MTQKTFNIGESSYYGRWQVKIDGEKITVNGIDWDTRKIERTDKFTTDDIDNFNLERHLTEMSTCYYAGQIMEWVKSKVNWKQKGGFW